MAQLALTVAGQVVGTYFGGPIGGMVGATIGSIVGGVIENILMGGGQKAAPPQIMDLRVQVSTYGNMRPILIGTNRVAGEVFWSTHLIPHIKKVSAGPGLGLGGGNPDALTVTYHVNIAIAFGEGVMANILRLWGDGKLIFDRRSGHIRRPRDVQATFRFYKGDNLQVANPTMQARDGDATPAYRGTSYLFIRGFLLTDFGNHIPNFTAEVAEESDNAFPYQTVATGGSSDTNLTVVLDDANSVVYRIGVGGDLAKVDAQGVTMIAGPIQSVAGLDGLGGSTLAADGFLYVPQASFDTPGAGTFNFEPWAKVDPITLGVVANIGTVSHTFGGVGNIPFTNGNIKARGNYLIGVCTMGFFAGYHTILVSVGQIELALGFIGGGNPRIVGQTSTAPDPAFDDADIDVQSQVLNKPSFPQGNTTVTFDIWGIIGAGGSTTCTLYRDTVIDHLGPAVDYGAFGANPISVAHTWDLTSEFSVNGPCSICYYDDQRAVIIRRGSKLLKWDLAGQFVSGAELEVGLDQGGPAFRQGPVDGLLYCMPNISTLVIIDVSNWEISDTIDLSGFGLGTITSQQYSVKDDALWVASGSTLYKLYLHKATSKRVSLAHAVRILEGKIGHTTADIDVTDIEDIMIWGYTVPRQMSADTALAQLCAIYDVDAVESDFKIVYRKRGHDPVMTISHTELGCYEAGTSQMPEPVPTTDIDPLEMPYRVVVKHINPNAAYQDGAQQDKRDGALVPSRVEVQIDAGTAPLTENEAKGVATRWLDQSWVERRSFDLSGSMKHILLDATDNIVVQDRNISYLVRILQQDIGVNWLVKLQGKAEDLTIHVPTAIIGSIGGGQGGYMPPPVLGQSASIAEFMDTVLLQDLDNGPGWYYAGGPLVDTLTWKGEFALRSIDGGGSYNTFITDTVEATMGRANNALADAPGGRWTTWDRINTVTVRLTSGTISSLTEDEILNGGNQALLGNELISFVNVTDNGNGTFTLNTFIRGQRGSEAYCATHHAGDRFVMVDRFTPAVDNITVDDLNLARSYKVMSIGEGSIPDVTYVFTNTGVRYKPQAPTNPLLAASGSDRIIKWQRRSRIGGSNNWADGVGTIPLGEDTESYAIEIYNGITLVRTLTSITNSVTYLDADQVTDFGSDQSALHIKIYQISAVVGRGWPCDAQVAL